jgi:hypothetical protein
MANNFATFIFTLMILSLFFLLAAIIYRIVYGEWPS